MAKKTSHLKVTKISPKKDDSRDAQFHLDIRKKNPKVC